jgi:lipid A 3-O-deacylase
MRAAYLTRHAGPESLVLLMPILGWVATSDALNAASPETQWQPQLSLTNALLTSELKLEPEASGVWQSDVGQGFRATAQSISVSAGATHGLAVFGGREEHDLALVGLSYGHMLGHSRGEGHWYQGNPEFRLELFTGAQYSPGSEWFVGLTPHLRYNFATGIPLVPFVDGGAGVTATGIGPPDLSGTFEFNLKAGGGVQWFVKHNVALSLEALYVHWSCAGINKPNLGLNGITGMLGLTYFF